MTTFNLKNFLVQAAQNAEITEKQLRKGKDQTDPTSVTQKQLDGQRSGEADKLTEAQLDKVRKAKTMRPIKTAESKDPSITEDQLHKGKDSKEPTSITQKQLDDYRGKEEENTTEARLEKVRTGNDGRVTEGLLNESKSKLVKHRNSETHTGDINKLEEQRVANKKRQETEEQKAIAETDKDLRFWEKPAGKDGLKLAHNFPIIFKTADDELDILQGDDPYAYEDWEDRLLKRDLEHSVRSPVLEQEQDPLFERNKDLVENLSVPIEDVNDVGESTGNAVDETELTGMFSEQTVESADQGGTMMAVRSLKFDTKDFLSNGQIDEEMALNMAVIFIRHQHPELSDIKSTDLEYVGRPLSSSGRPTSDIGEIVYRAPEVGVTSSATGQMEELIEDPLIV